MFKLSALVLATSVFASCAANATIVEFQTTHGSFQVNLFDESTPQTVDNFLQYVQQERYKESVIHRVIPEFVLQAGGFKYDGEIPLTAIETFDPVVNEPKWSNVAGTIAMAKVEGRPDSATSQWFFNLVDNSANLDVSNGGFTVFGQVMGEGMAVLEAISEVPRCGNVPLVDYTEEQCKDSSSDPGAANFVTINSVVIIDDAANTAQDLDPVANTLIDQQPDPDDNDNSNNDAGSSGGSMFGTLALLAGLLGFRRRKV